MTDKEFMLCKLSEESDMVIATAYMYAVNKIKFNKDVTEKWTTAITQSMALDEAYVRGRIDSDNEWRERLATCSKEEAADEQ